VDTGKCIVLVFLIFCTYSIIRKIVSIIEMGIKHDITREQVEDTLKVEKVEFDDIKEGDLK